MALHGVLGPPLMTYDAQWRATYFLSINDARGTKALVAPILLSDRFGPRSGLWPGRFGSWCTGISLTTVPFGI